MSYINTNDTQNTLKRRIGDLRMIRYNVEKIIEAFVKIINKLLVNIK